MVQHLHSEFVPGCYRCDLSRGEIAPGLSVTINATGKPERVMSQEELRAAIENIAIERQLRRERKRR